MAPLQVDLFKFFSMQLFGIPLGNWVAAGLAILISLLVLIMLRRASIARLSRVKTHTRFEADAVALDLLEYTRAYFIIAVAFTIGSIFITLSPKVGNGLRVLFIILFLLQAAVWGNRLVAIFVSRALTRPGETNLENAAAIHLIGLLARVLLWVVIILLILGNIPGFNVSTLIASLGITGIAVAFALQKVLADLFASFSIALDKPFVVGDYIVVGDQQGTVEHIGLKSTRIRSISGDQLIISNSDLLASRIHNYQRMEKRRVTFDLKISWKIPREKLVSIPGILKDLVESEPKVSFDQAIFSEIGDGFYCYQVIYYILSSDYHLYTEIQQSINLGIIDTFVKERIPFAFQ